MSPTHAFTVDLEEWFHGIELPRAEWPSSSRLDVGLDRLLALLDRHGVTATFFVLGAVAERFPQRVAELAALGHEIACHGHFHDFVYRLSPHEFREDIRRARDAIADASGVSPDGYRAPYFSITRESLWALEILAEEGFKYDSSIFPVRNDRYGIPGTPVKPYRHDLQGRDLREVPLTPLRMLGANVPFAGGAYLRILPWWTQVLAWRAATRRGMNVVAYVHPWELDPDHPRIPLRRRVAATHYARLALTEGRLERLLSTYDFGRIDSIIRL
ncbi:MAG: DUF3473 domain-containing protein [Actinomycetota bacterium]